MEDAPILRRAHARALIWITSIVERAARGRA
jgi:hypothetical protein